MCKFGDPANRQARKTLSLPKAPVVKEQQATDDDYGFFEDMDINDPMTCDRSFSTSCDGETDFSTGFSSPTTVPASESDNSMSTDTSMGTSVVCAVEDGSAPLTCRYFPNGDDVSVSVDGFRIIREENSTEDAEFKVHLTVNGKELTAWRKASDFESIAQAVFQFSQVYHQENPYAMHNTMCAWGEYVRFRGFHRPYGVQHAINSVVLSAETNLLRTFMMNLLFEIPTTCMILVKFVSPAAA